MKLPDMRNAGSKKTCHGRRSSSPSSTLLSIKRERIQGGSFVCPTCCWQSRPTKMCLVSCEVPEGWLFHRTNKDKTRIPLAAFYSPVASANTVICVPVLISDYNKVARCPNALLKSRVFTDVYYCSANRSLKCGSHGQKNSFILVPVDVEDSIEQTALSQTN